MHHHAGLLIHFEAVKAKFHYGRIFYVKNQVKLHFTFNSNLLLIATVHFLQINDIFA